MGRQKERIIVGMSGGVDSAVSAALLIEQGYDVIGVMLQLWRDSGTNGKSPEYHDTINEHIRDLKLITQQLGIPLEIVNARDAFLRRVVEPFVCGYEQGITPNPCLTCNPQLKFDRLLEEARFWGASKIATGHYARIRPNENGSVSLYKGRDPHKDQSYVLAMIPQAMLQKVVLPLGEYTKDEVREYARRQGIQVAGKSESQDLCFIAEGNYREFLRSRGIRNNQPGPIRLSSGEIIGEHSGLPDYTIGQRKGIGIAWAEPLYVIAKDIGTNSLIVGIRSELGGTSITVRNVNWISGSPPDNTLRVEVKIRYKAEPAPALVIPAGYDRADVRLDHPLDDITPGQGAVFYQGDMVIGGGIIAGSV
ncbi:MAG: tRNA 2-thiouridine(34) synthase MnmA [Anaerolineae bacterium]|nr:tRNA 2-thiouridine(34) synthase MnmA [Anaerolineae bacterium]